MHSCTHSPLVLSKLFLLVAKKVWQQRRQLNQIKNKKEYLGELLVQRYTVDRANLQLEAVNSFFFMLFLESVNSRVINSVLQSHKGGNGG